MSKFFKTILLLVLIVQQSLVAGAGPMEDDGTNEDYFLDSFPVPSGIPNQLFYLQRTPNTNTIIYEVNLGADGKVNKEEPIHVFWIRYPEGGVHKELNYIQKHFAYGVTAEPMNDGRYKLTFAAYKKRNFYLAFAPRDKKYHVYGMVGNKVAMLVRVFIQINPGGTFWSPNVQYIEIRGWEVGTGKEVTERIIIKKTS